MPPPDAQDAREPAHQPAGGVVFATTRWTMVLQAGAGDGPETAGALESLCASYWLPLYAYVRRLGFPPADAEDLTQAFFARLLERGYLAQVDRSRGRFRTFLVTALRHFISDEMDRVQAWKRGGRALHVPLDAREAEEWLDRHPAAAVDPEHSLDRAWAEVLLQRAGRRLREEAVRAGREALFDALGVLGGGAAPEPFESVGRRLGLSEGAVKAAAFRLRQRYRELIREEVAGTVADPAELEAEIRHLLAVLAPVRA